MCEIRNDACQGPNLTEDKGACGGYNTNLREASKQKCQQRLAGPKHFHQSVSDLLSILIADQ